MENKMSQEKTNEIIQILDNLFDELNHMGNEENVIDALNTVLSKQHRTLQQNFFRYVIVPSIKNFEEKYQQERYDLRNQASCELAHELYSHVEKSHLPFV